MNKPTKPSETLPSSFGGEKTNFSASKIATGYEKDVADIFGGANLNYLIDTLGKIVVYHDAIADYINAIPINKTPFVNANNQLVYTRMGMRVYDVSETYFLNDSVVGLINDKMGFYRSLQNNNIGQPLTNTTYWEKFAQVENYNTYFNIGEPQFTLDFATLPENCIWLEGAEVSRTTYASLFAIYGTSYGAGDGSTTFNLPDFRNRAIWGANSAGYLSAGLPNITGATTRTGLGISGTAATFSGAFLDSTTGSDSAMQGGWDNTEGYFNGKLNFKASNSNSIYGNSTTVQPPAIKVRVYTRYQ